MRFAEGLPSRGVRPLSPGERARTEDARARAGQKAAAGVLLPVGWVGLGWALALAAQGAGDVVQGLAAVALVSGLFVGTGAGLLVFRDGLRVRRALTRDLAAGVAEAFESPPGAAEPRRLVLLPGSTAVLERDGLPLRPARGAVVGDVAPAPAETGGWAMPLSEVPEGTQRFAWTKRPLTSEERGELAARVKTLRRGPWVLAGFSAYAALLLPATLAEAQAAPAFSALRIVFWVAVLGFGWRAFLRRRRLSVALAHDLEQGVAARATQGEAAGLEVLPASGAHWSKDGLPAPWRVSASRRRPWR